MHWRACTSLTGVTSLKKWHFKGHVAETESFTAALSTLWCYNTERICHAFFFPFFSLSQQNNALEKVLKGDSGFQLLYSFHAVISISNSNHHKPSGSDRPFIEDNLKMNDLLLKAAAPTGLVSSGGDQQHRLDVKTTSLSSVRTVTSIPHVLGLY